MANCVSMYQPTKIVNEAINMPQKENTHCQQLPGFYVFIQVEEPPARQPPTEPPHHILPHCVNMLATNYEKQHLLWPVVRRMLHVQQQHQPHQQLWRRSDTEFAF
uniref:HDC08294 n=1 Tax=Drosophila melanogaster TaxID=7227 RepID=Q6ILU8_DROME|nr:TPA_inf: HDC08294 [Drosophila melanogaster]